MNTTLNYLIEANLALLFFYACYWLLLSNENQFSLNRAYLLGSLIASLLFPLISIPNAGVQLIPSLSHSPAAYWLPEITIYANAPEIKTNATTQTSYLMWIPYIYYVGFILFSALFVVRVVSLIRLFKRSKKYHWKNYLVAETAKSHVSFSFFRFIFLGQATELSEQEKHDVLIHEEAHAQKIHSFDIVLVNMLGIIFWFNPVIYFYRNSLVQVHEFEADARSVEGRDVNTYCSLLARVALQSNGYPLANHFTNSLTLKRITMMKTVRTKIKQWKVATATMVVLLIFFIVACQDQVMQDIKTITDNSSAATVLPAQVEAELIRLKQANPNAEYIVMEMNDEGRKKMEVMEKDEAFKKNLIGISVVKTTDQSFAILQKGDRTNALAQMTATDGEVFSIVEESAVPIGGYPALYEYIGKNLKYPQQARSMGVEGKVFIEFIVNVDGTLSNLVAIKGIGAGCDAEAINVLQNSSVAWTPGKHGGNAVRQRMVIPINFILGSGNAAQIAINDVQNVNTSVENGIYSVVEESATPIGGYTVLYEHIAKNLRYPQQARRMGVEGKVFIEFVVNVDGTLSDFVTVKGIGAGCDGEAIRVLQNSTIAWTPGKQQGLSVKQRLVLPITFKLGVGEPGAIVIGETQSNYLGSQYEFKVNVEKTVVNGITQISGTVKNQDDTPLTGTNIVIMNTTTGTVSTSDGSFKLNTPQNNGSLVFSFVGYKTIEVNF